MDTEFLARLADDITPEGAIEVLHMFMEDGPERMAAIERGMADGRIPTVRHEAHAMAGAACNVGLTTRLGEAAHALQRASEGTGVDPAAVVALAALLRDGFLAARWIEEHEELVTPGD